MTALMPRVVVFDVNETLSDLAPMRQRFVEIGLPESAASLWFASVLRDGMALAAVGQTAAFAEIGGAVLDPLLSPSLSAEQRSDAVDHVLGGFTSLPVHPDVPDGLRALRERGLRLVTLSNGSASVAEGLLERAGVRDLVEATLSVADAGIWKPAARAYAYGVAQVGEPAQRCVLAAVHPWDVHGAQQSGLLGAWIDRTGEAIYPDYFDAPNLGATDLLDLANRLAPPRD